MHTNQSDSSHVKAFRSMLEEFHETFKLPIVKSWSECNKDAIPLRINLIAEEFAEYQQAAVRKDILDALGDLTYVVAGTWITIGVFPPDYTEHVALMKTNHKPDLLRPVIAYLTELRKDKLCYMGLTSSTTVLHWQLEHAAFVLGVDLYILMSRIHASNMTKLWSPLDLPNKPDATTAYETKRGYVVKRNLDGKVIKSPGYKPVDLTDL